MTSNTATTRPKARSCNVKIVSLKARCTYAKLIRQIFKLSEQKGCLLHLLRMV